MQQHKEVAEALSAHGCLMLHLGFFSVVLDRIVGIRLCILAAGVCIVVEVALRPGILLRGGTRIGNWQHNNDYFYAPKTGWRLIRVYDHSGNAESMTLSIGGRGDWSGDLYMSEPVVREVSLAEAVIHHPKVLKHSPLNNGFPLHFEIGKGLPGYAYLRNNVRRMAKDFPNALRITTDLPTPRTYGNAYIVHSAQNEPMNPPREQMGMRILCILRKTCT